MRRYLLITLIVLCISPIGTAQQLPAQPAGQQPAVTFRTETNFVEVHAIVTDEKGNFVRGLTADDFEVYEDGKLQKPAIFSYVDLPIERPFTPLRGTEPIEPDVRTARRTFDGRIYVFLLDDLQTNVTRTRAVREAARKFIQQYFGADDLAAVVYTSGRGDAGQELTNNRRLLMAAIDRFQGRKIPSAGVEKLAVHLREASTEEILADDPQPIRTNEGAERARQVRDPLDQERGYNARRALQAIGNVAKWLSDVQGRRKALLFFSEGIDYDIYAPFTISSGVGDSLVLDAQQAIAAAQRANVNVYGIDPRGLSQFGEMIDVNARSDYPQLDYGTFRGFLRELLLAQESLISLSQETGGLAVVNSGDVVGGLGRIVLDNSRYYLLGYYSDPTKWSGKFLKIDVRVRRPGLRVRARRGYLPPDPKAVAKAREADVKAGTSPALKAALGKPIPVGDLSTRVFAAPFKGTGKNASVLVALEIEGKSLKFQQREGRYVEKIEVSIVASDEDGKVQGGDRQTFDLNLLPQTYEKVSATGVRLLSRLDVPTGRYQIRVGAFETGGGAIAAVPYDVDIPDYAKAPFELSGVVVTSSTADSLATANSDPQLKDVLPSPPSVTRSFRSNDTLTTFAEVYDNSSPTAHAINVVTSVQDARDGRDVFSASDRRVIEASKRTATHGFRTEIPLKGLTAGMYVLRVDAASTADGKSVHRDVLFEVN